MRHADSEKLLGYEIRRNGKAIGFTTSDTYTDDLLSLIHISSTRSRWVPL